MGSYVCILNAIDTYGGAVQMHKRTQPPNELSYGSSLSEYFSKIKLFSANKVPNMIHLATAHLVILSSYQITYDYEQKSCRSSNDLKNTPCAGPTPRNHMCSVLA